MKMKLLPHKFQKPAMLVWILSYAFGIAYISYQLLLNSNGVSTERNLQPWVFKAVFILFSILISGSILVMIFSKEKVEDEYINSLRLESVAIVAVIFILYIFVFRLFTGMAASPSEWKDMRVMRNENIAKNADLLPLLYFIIFKIKLRRHNAGDEE